MITITLQALKIRSFKFVLFQRLLWLFLCPFQVVTAKRFPKQFLLNSIKKHLLSKFYRTITYTGIM